MPRTHDARTRWIPPALIVACALAAIPVLVSGQSGASGTTAPVTFTRDVAPILQRSCQRCHRPGSVAPMSLLTYDEVRPWARSIKHRVTLGSKPDVMPPWFIDKTMGIQRFKDDMSLSDAEIAKIVAWVDAGAPRGNPADMPPPLKVAPDDEWQLGKPDLIVTSPVVEMDANSPDRWGPMGETPSGLQEDRYVASVEIKEISESIDATPAKDAAPRTVGGQAIVHHLNWHVVGPKGNRAGDESSTLIWPVHEVGRNPDVFDAEAGKLMPAGAKVLFMDAHLHSNGRRTKARIMVGFKFHPRGYTPTKRFVQMRVSTPHIDIRGSEANQIVEGYTVLKEHTKIMIFEPHLHAAGVRQCLEAIWDNTTDTLACAGYNHGWVRVYTYADDAQPLLPKFTILRMVSYFDTTPANKNLADGRNWSGNGQRSIDNMAVSIVTVLPLTDDQFQDEMSRRRQQLSLRSGQSVIGCPLCGYDKGRPMAGAR